MKLWRISNYADLKGGGGIKTPGRWHNKGIPVVYLSESPSLAMLETLVNFELDINEVPENYRLLEIDYPGSQGIQQLADDSLIDGWRQSDEYTRAIGDEWLSAMHSVLLRVPSVIVPHSFNYLLNPRHELASSAKILSCQDHPFDLRLIL
ncbi:MAG: RES domain-containing protein [Planctomycetota bacterium]|jgi:RES domain-containing protein